MNRLLILPVLLLTLLAGTPAFAADFQKGLTAADKGDFTTALREWTPLAEKGDADAQFNLGLMYEKGRGVPQDFVYAHMWGNIAASNGNENGGKLRGLVAKEMTPSQIADAQNLAHECVRKKYKGC